jgi:hypothetical protein
LRIKVLKGTDRIKEVLPHGTGTDRIKEVLPHGTGTNNFLRSFTVFTFK